MNEYTRDTTNMRMVVRRADIEHPTNVGNGKGVEVTIFESAEKIRTTMGVRGERPSFSALVRRDPNDDSKIASHGRSKFPNTVIS
jgi:hypothetical protein